MKSCIFRQMLFGIIVKLSLNNGQTELVDLFFQELSFYIEKTGKNMK